MNKVITIPTEWLNDSNVEIARRLGVSPTAILYARRRMQNLCERCGKPALPSLRNCAKHRANVNKRSRRLKGHKPWRQGGPGRPPLGARKDV